MDNHRLGHAEAHKPLYFHDILRLLCNAPDLELAEHASDASFICMVLWSTSCQKSMFQLGPTT